MTTIAPLADDDRPAWEWLFAGYNSFYGRTLAPALMDRAWRELRADRIMHGRGARLDGRLVGIAHFMIHPSTTAPDVCYLQDLFTDAAARGRGVGRALIAAAADWARARGCCRLYWMTHESNATARRLYDAVAENRGFIRYQIELGA